MSAPTDPGSCRVCGRSCLPHRSFACRSCRRGKPDIWIARAKREESVTPILTREEREIEKPRGWMDWSRKSWERRSQGG